MTTAPQLFHAACNEALRSSALRDAPVQKILNRLDIDVVLEMQHALAQHFIILLRNAAEGVDVLRRGPSIGERIERMEKMRTVSQLAQLTHRREGT